MGELVVQADGSYEFTPNAALQGLDDNESIVVNLPFTADDGTVTDGANLTLTLNGSNDGPVASAEVVGGTEDSGTLTGNLDATDLDGEALTFTLDGHTPDASGVTTVAVQGTVDGETVTVGQLTVQPDGSYAFEPDNSALQAMGEGDTVQTDFTFTASDGTATDSDTFSITLTGTNDDLIAKAEVVQGTEDSSVLTGNLDATDPEGDPVSFGIPGVDADPVTGATTVAVQGTVNGETVTIGELVVQQDGSYAFTPDSAVQALDDNEQVQSEITFSASDGENTAENTITLTVAGSNDGPTATAEVVDGGEDDGTLTGNLQAGDLDGDDLTFGLAAQEDGAGQYGDLTVNPDGSYSFALNADAQGLDDGETATETFTFQVSDGTETTTQTITVNIAGSNDGPTASAETIDGTEDSGVLTGNLDAEDADGDAVTFTIDGETPNANGVTTISVQGVVNGVALTVGQLVVQSDGSYSFTPDNVALQSLDDGEKVQVVLPFTANDGTTDSASANLTLTLTGSNDGPVAAETAISGTEDSNVLTGNLQATDVEGDDLTFTVDGETPNANGVTTIAVQGDVNGSTVTVGQLVVQADGSYEFTPDNAALQDLDAGEQVQVNLTFTASDGTSTDSAGLTLTLTGSDDGSAPVATPEVVSGHEDDGVINGNSGPQETTVTATFDGEGAGYQNIVGMYKVDADGNITDVEFVWENASLQRQRREHAIR